MSISLYLDGSHPRSSSEDISSLHADLKLTWDRLTHHLMASRAPLTRTMEGLALLLCSVTLLMFS